MRLWAPLLLLSLTACGSDDAGAGRPDDGGQTGDETPPCEPEPMVDVALDEVTSAGFSAQQVLDLAAAAPAATMTYKTGATTQVTFAAELAESARYSEQCRILYLPTLLSVTPADGLWAVDAKVVTLIAAGPTVANGDVIGTPSELGVDVDGFELGEHASYEARLGLVFSVDSAFGILTVTGLDPDGTRTKYPLGSF